MAIEITGQKATVTVGERVDLGVKFSKEWGILKTVEWNIPGKIVKNYVDGQTTAKVTQILPADKTKFAISFYWVDGQDSRTVEAKCVFTVDGKDTDKTVSATFDVKRPKLDKLESVTDVVGLDPAAAPTQLRFGLAGKKGIRWVWKISANGAIAGEVKDIQLIKADYRQTTAGGVKRVWAFHGKNTPPGVWQLDNENPYGSKAYLGAARGGPWPLAAGGDVSDTGISDNPGNPLGTNQRVSIDLQFQYYLLFRPKVQKGSAIWIPLGMLPWWCKGTAIFTTGPAGLIGVNPIGVHGWIASGVANSSNPSGAETFDFPEYTTELMSSTRWENE